MIVVADTTPLNYLVLIEGAPLSPVLFGTVLMPQAVCNELRYPRASPRVRPWIDEPPSWLESGTVSPSAKPALLEFDPGEREAIQSPLDWGIRFVRMDEADGPVSKPLVTGVAQAAGRTCLPLTARTSPLSTHTCAQTNLSPSLFACDKAARTTYSGWRPRWATPF
jgi:hypothetical protein